MNQSRLLERNILSDLITRNSRGPIARACYLHYRAPFLQIFSALKGMDKKKATHLYTQTFPRLCVELEDNRGRWIKDGTLFDGLLLLGEKRLKKENPNLTFQDITSPSRFIDSDLLLQFLADGNTSIIEEVQKGFKEPAGRVFCAEQGISVSGKDKLEEILEPYYEAFATFYDKIQKGSVQPPMRSTLFTYFYQFFRRKTLEHHRTLVRIKGPEIAPDEPYIFDQPQEVGSTYFDQLLDRLDNRLQRAQDEKSLVQQLIKKLDKICQQLIVRYYLQGESLQDLGAELDLPSPKKRIHDCRQKIRKMIS